MSLNLTNLFTALGRVGREAFITNGQQDELYVPFNELIVATGVNPTWLQNLIPVYDAGIRNCSAILTTWAQAAQIILQGMVLADAPTYGTSLGASLSYLYAQMIAQASTVASCTITDSVVADAANIGTPAILVSLKRPDGLIQQNIIAEISSLVYTDDSYTGSATTGQEPWQWSGAPNISSLGTGTPVGIWDWDSPQGSAVSATGSNISASEDATASGNYLTNGDCESWTGTSPAVLDNWHLVGGTWGTDLIRDTIHLGGTYSVKFIAGTSTTEYLTQQFDSAITDGTNAATGTDVPLTALQQYGFNFWLKRDGVVSAGVLTISLVDSAGTVINDQQGVANSTTITLSGLTTSFVAHNVTFRLPKVLPTDGIIRLKIRMSTALTGANIYMDDLCLAMMVSCYAGGPSILSFSNPAVPVESSPDPDGFNITFTNDRASATYNATWQALLNRLFQTPEFLAPYSGSPTIADTLITDV